MDDGRNPDHEWRAVLDALLAKHPRSTWREARSPTALFWLEVHEHLRRSASGLEAASQDSRSGRSSAAQFAVIASPRLHGLVAGMHGHHQIEDFHYFPALRREEPKLARGFDLLEAEHAALVLAVADAETALAALRAAADTQGAPHDASKIGAERASSAIERLCANLVAHLGREEELVVPLLIDRGEP